MLASLLRIGPASRAELARQTGLTAAAASSVVASLVDDGLIEEIGRRSVGVGKPATLLGIIPDSRLTVALDLSDEHEFRGALLDLSGKVIHRESVRRRQAVGGDAIELVIALAASLIERADRPLLGIGCGSPGIIDADGTVVRAVDLDWHEEPLAHRVATATGVSAWAVNDANAAALAEYSFGTDSTPNVVVVRVARGVGAGIILHGDLFLGDHFAAGEIGHVTVADTGSVCGCGRVGCLETLVSAPAIAARLLAEPEDRTAILSAAGDYLGIALASLIGALDLNRIVLSGPIDVFDERVRTAALATIQQRTMPIIGDRVALSLSTLGDDDVLLGAAALVLRNALGIA